MLDFSRTRFRSTREVPLLSTVRLNDEGQAMQMVLENGAEHCRPSNATDGSIFLGISWGEPFAPPMVTTKIETVTLDAQGNAQLTRAPTAYQDMQVLIGSDYTGTALTGVASGTPTDAQFKLVGQQLVTNVAQANRTAFVIYRSNLLAIESQSMFGDRRPGGQSINTYGKTGIITAGQVYTDQFDVSVNWAAATDESAAKHIRCGQNGKFTMGTTGGADCGQRVHVLEAPSPSSPWLGLYLGSA